MANIIFATGFETGTFDYPVPANQEVVVSFRVYNPGVFPTGTPCDGCLVQAQVQSLGEGWSVYKYKEPLGHATRQFSDVSASNPVPGVFRFIVKTGELGTVTTILFNSGEVEELMTLTSCEGA